MYRADRLLIWGMCCYFATMPSWAEENKGPTIVKLMIHGSQLTSPPTAFALQPTLREQKPGNGAIFFYRALHAAYRQDESRKALKELEEKREAWQKNLHDPATREAIHKCLRAIAPQTFNDLREAASREQASFEFRLHEVPGRQAFEFLLGELQDSRAIARALSMRTRLSIAENQLPAAIESLRMELALARIVAVEPLLINRLVGAAIARTAFEDLEQFLAHPQAPSMYWQITALPSPFISMREAAEFEAGFPEQVFPILKDAATAQRTPEEWNRFMMTMLLELRGLEKMEPNPEKSKELSSKEREEMERLLTDSLATAKTGLIQSGLKDEQVQAMSRDQILVLRMAQLTKQLTSETPRLFQARPLDYEAFAEQLDQHLKQAKQAEPFASRLAAALLPAVNRVYFTQLTLERDAAGLKVLEAIRLHAGQTGKLPENLAEIQIVPVPLNPVTQQPFPYQLQAGTAMLELPPTETKKPSTGRKYEITLGKSP